MIVIGHERISVDKHIEGEGAVAEYSQKKVIIGLRAENGFALVATREYVVYGTGEFKS
jgi:hypothetical protein